MATLDKLKIKYFDDMVKLEQDKQRIIKLEPPKKETQEITKWFNEPPKAKPLFNPYNRLLYRCGCCEVKVKRRGMLCQSCYAMDDCKSCSNGYNQEGACGNCMRVSDHTYIKQRQDLENGYKGHY